MELNHENIEEYILLLADNELDEAEDRAVRVYVEQHEAYKPMLEAYLAAHLDAEETFVFPDKESLLKPETMAVPLRKNNFTAFKIAAVVALLLGLGTAMMLMFSDREPGSDNHSMASKNTGVQRNAASPYVQKSPDTVMVVQVNPAMTTTRPVRDRQTRQQVRNTLPSVQKPAVTAEKEPALAYLDNTALNKIPVDVGVEANTIVMVEKVSETEKSSIPGWLPVNEENLQGVNALINHIQELKESIQQKTQSIKNTAFVIRIGEKQIPIGNHSDNN